MAVFGVEEVREDCLNKNSTLSVIVAGYLIFKANYTSNLHISNIIGPRLELQTRW